MRAWLVLLALCVQSVAAQAPQSLELSLGEGRLLRWERGSSPQVLVTPKRGDGWLRMAKRLCLGEASACVDELKTANPGLAAPKLGKPVALPLEHLEAALRLEAVRRLFPADARVDGGWRHLVLDPYGEGESWEWLAELFTGRRDQAGALRSVNAARSSSGPRRGSAVMIPKSRLLEIFRRQELAARPTPRPSPSPTPTPRPTVIPTPRWTSRPRETPSPTPTPVRTRSPVKSPTASAVVATPDPLKPTPLPTPLPIPITGQGAGGELDYAKDDLGDVAIYRLKQGEALYSAVVVRFTGQLHAADVNATAQIIARRSGIPDVTSIPIDFPVKIPFGVLLSEFLPRGDPRRAAFETEQAELERFVEVVRATDLDGVQIILDAGHGGVDSGAVVDDTWEATYVYDIMVRVKQVLETHTKATVWVTIKDEVYGFKPRPQGTLESHRKQVILTDPPYALKDSRTGVHLRWYLGNSITLERERSGTEPTKVVFLSLHADSLHSSVRGAMAYVPSRRLRPDTFTVGRDEMKRYRQYRENPRIHLSSLFKSRAEASSTRLASRLIRTLDDNDIAVHPHKPVRDVIRRGRSEWVPAVLKHSYIRQAILLEVCNLANTEDRALLKSAEWRQDFALAVVEGLAANYR